MRSVFNEGHWCAPCILECTSLMTATSEGFVLQIQGSPKQCHFTYGEGSPHCLPQGGRLILWPSRASAMGLSVCTPLSPRELLGQMCYVQVLGHALMLKTERNSEWEKSGNSEAWLPPSPQRGPRSHHWKDQWPSNRSLCLYGEAMPF